MAMPSATRGRPVACLPASIVNARQITDVEIDKVNKPFLPIPAGNLTPFAARATVTLCLLAGVLMGLAPSTLGSPGLAVRAKAHIRGFALSILVAVFVMWSLCVCIWR